MAFDTAVLALDVLTKTVLRDALLAMASESLGFYNPVWSSTIMAQMQNQLKAEGFPELEINRLTDELADAFPTANVGNPPATLVAEMKSTVPDKEALATAAIARAAFVISGRADDFLPADCDRYRVEAVTPDSFLQTLYDESDQDVLDSLFLVCSRYTSPPLKIMQFITLLKDDGAPGLWYRLTNDYQESTLDWMFEVYGRRAGIVK